MSAPKVLVTGATGLIGVHAAARLVSEGHAVRALVRDETKLARVLEPFPGAAAGIEAYRGNVTDAGSVEGALVGCEGLLHCAGIFSHDLSAAARLHSVNVEGTRRALGAAARRGAGPIVHVSSLLALRLPPPGTMQRVTDPVARPRAMYAATKALAERVARELVGADPIPIERSLRDLLVWMHRAGVLDARHVGRLVDR
jgi:dihydroflavonol-4-reductase